DARADRSGLGLPRTLGRPCLFRRTTSRHRDPCASSSMRISPTSSGCCLPAMKSELSFTRAGLTNGALLRAAEDAAFDAILTADQGIRYQQNRKHCQVALIVLSDNDES